MRYLYMTILSVILLSLSTCNKPEFEIEEEIQDEYPVPVDMIGIWTEYLIFDEHGIYKEMEKFEWEFRSDLSCTRREWDKSTNSFSENKDVLYWQYKSPMKVMGSPSGIKFVSMVNIGVTGESELCRFNSTWLDPLPKSDSDSLTCVYINYGCDINHLEEYSYLWVRGVR